MALPTEYNNKVVPKTVSFKSGVGTGASYFAPAKTPTTKTTGGTTSTTTQTVPRTLTQPEYSVPEYQQYTSPGINVALPDLNYTPTEEAKQNLLNQAIQQAMLWYQPQADSLNQGLTRFQDAATQQQQTVMPQYRDMSLAAANTFKNQVRQPLIDAAIRRGADSSGWLPEQLANAGNQEVAARTDIGSKLADILNQIGSQVTNKTQETSDSLNQLSSLKGQKQQVTYDTLLQQAKTDYLNQKEQEFNNALAVAQAQNAAAAQAAGINQQGQQLALQAGNQQYNADNTNQQNAFNQALQQYQLQQQQAKSYAPVANQTPAYLTPGTNEWYRYQLIQNAINNKGSGTGSITGYNADGSPIYG